MKTSNGSHLIIAALIISAGLIFFGYQYSNSSAQNGQDFQAQLEKGIEKYIENQQKAAAKQTVGSKIDSENVKKVSKEDHIRGNTDAILSLIEYSDFECPFCKRFHPTAQKVVDANNGKVNWIYRHYPLSFHNPLATQQALASECAAEIGGNDVFWKYTDKIFEITRSNGRGMTKDQLTEIASDLKIDENTFQNCLDSEKYQARIRQDIKEGSKAGVTGTPGSILLNNKTGEARFVKGAQPFESVQAVIDEMLK